MYTHITITTTYIQCIYIYKGNVQAEVLNKIEKGQNLEDIFSYILDECDGWWPETIRKENKELFQNDLQQKISAVKVIQEKLFVLNCGNNDKNNESNESNE